MKKILLFILLLLIVSTSFAQRRKTIFAEALGNGVLLSGNFDIRLKPNQNDGLGFRAGIGGGSLSATDGMGSSVSAGLVTFPLSVNYVVGKKRSGFESGVGLTPMYATASVQTNSEFAEGNGFGVTGFLNAGYRYQPINNGVAFRINWAPAFNSAGFSPEWFGLSLGYSFK